MRSTVVTQPASRAKLPGARGQHTSWFRVWQPTLEGGGPTARLVLAHRKGAIEASREYHDAIVAIDDL